MVNGLFLLDEFVPIRIKLAFYSFHVVVNVRMNFDQVFSRDGRKFPQCHEAERDAVNFRNLITKYRLNKALLS